MKILKKYKQEVTNKAGLTFKLQFNPILKRLTVSCLNPPGLSFRSYVEEVMESTGIEEVDDVLMGIVYKCQSYEHFQKIKEKVQKS